MIGEIVWTSGATADLQAIYSYLEDSCSGAGDVFLASVDRVIELLKTFPDQGRQVSTNARKMLVGRRRVHGLIYCTSPRKIHVVAVLDLRRHPVLIAETLRERGIP